MYVHNTLDRYFQYLLTYFAVGWRMRVGNRAITSASPQMSQPHIRIPSGFCCSAIVSIEWINDSHIVAHDFRFLSKLELYRERLQLKLLGPPGLSQPLFCGLVAIVQLQAGNVCPR